MKHLKTIEAACKLLGYKTEEVLPDVSKMPQGLAKATLAATKLFILSEAAWKAAGKVIDWNDNDQYKYYPWFDLETYDKSAGSPAGFSFDGSLCDDSFSCVGSRLCYPDRDTEKFVAETHLQLYRDMMVIE